MKLIAKQIPVPDYARTPDVIDGSVSNVATEAFRPLLKSIKETLRLRLEAEFNNPDIVFTGPDVDFPVKSELTGEFYFSDISYDEEEDCYQAMLMLHCLEKEGRKWGDNPPDYDYLGMEMSVYLSKKTGALEYDDHFTSSSI